MSACVDRSRLEKMLSDVEDYYDGDNVTVQQVVLEILSRLDSLDKDYE